MYYMKNIIDHYEKIELPKCMYHVKNLSEPSEDVIDSFDEINIAKQVTKFLQTPNTKMEELEQRQEQLLEKLDILYDRIKTISSYCNSNNSDVKIITSEATKAVTPALEEVVLVTNPDNLPYFVNILKESSISVNICWHIHSSVPNEKLVKIQGFVKTLKVANNSLKINLRLIIKNESADPELKLSSLSVPIVGTVNILRYLSDAYPNTIPYDDTDFKMDSLLDICHLLEHMPEKYKESLFQKLFAESKDWICKNKFSIVDLAAFNIVKQSRSSVKYVPKAWFNNCEKLCV